VAVGVAVLLLAFSLPLYGAVPNVAKASTEGSGAFANQYMFNTFVPVTEGLGSVLSICNNGLQLATLLNLTFLPVPLRMAHSIQGDTNTFFELDTDVDLSLLASGVHTEVRELIPPGNIVPSINLDTGFSVWLDDPSSVLRPVLPHVDPRFHENKLPGEYTSNQKDVIWTTSIVRDLHRNWNAGLYTHTTGEWFRRKYWAARARQGRTVALDVGRTSVVVHYRAGGLSLLSSTSCSRYPLSP
jgi:hypothetical protein